jgi:hypothetical protein
MRSVLATLSIAGLLAASLGLDVAAQDKATYERRSIERFVELFAWLDLDHDNAVSRAEAEGDLNFLPVFDDADIDRDGTVSKAELDRFLALRYGASPR